VADAVIEARKYIFNAGLIPNIAENPRNRFDHSIGAFGPLRMTSAFLNSSPFSPEVFLLHAEAAGVATAMIKAENHTL